MTRWEALLDALGVEASRFECDHQSKFDLSARAWVRERLEELRAGRTGRDSDKEPVTPPCDRPCCESSS